MSKNLERFQSIDAELADLGYISSLLDWDQQTNMPEGSAGGRANQMATLMSLIHSKQTAASYGKLLAALSGEKLKPVQTAAVRVARRDYAKATKIPGSFVEDFSRTTTLAHGVWQEARHKSDFKLFQPHLEKIVSMVRKQADYLGFKDHPYDALLDSYEPDMQAKDVKKLFSRLREEIVPLVRSIVARGDITDYKVLTKNYDETKQEAFGLEVIKTFGYDFSRGRQDRAAHPFCTHFGRDDVRITTRYDKNFVPMALFGTFHEAGHAMYEQGVAASLDRSSLSGGTSLGVHESQSRMWENLVGRSKAFWVHWYPKLQATFPKALGKISLNDFYAAINHVNPSLIRVEADEATYNLHIMVRFEIELGLVEGSIAVKDLPEIWNEKMKEYLGVTPKNDAEGVLQDVHWSGGGIGYFPTYTIGNVLSVQLLDAARKDLGDLETMWSRGQYAPLRDWLREHVHQYGRRYTPKELVKRVTGKELSTEPYLAYLKAKYGSLYKIK